MNVHPERARGQTPALSDDVVRPLPYLLQHLYVTVWSASKIAQRADGGIRYDRKKVKGRDWPAGVPFHIWQDDETWGAAKNRVCLRIALENVPNPVASNGIST